MTNLFVHCASIVINKVIEIKIQAISLIILKIKIYLNLELILIK